jgi:charged multivesicular body protein 4
MLEKKECFLQKKCSAEIEKAKDYTKSKNKNGKESLIWIKDIC